MGDRNLRPAWIGLILATAGAAMPYGLTTYRQGYLSPLEIGLSVLAVIATVGLVLELVTRRRHSWPLAVTTYVWAVLGVYTVLVPAPLAWHLSIGLVCAGLTALAWSSWQATARHRKEAKGDHRA